MSLNGPGAQATMPGPCAPLPPPASLWLRLPSPPLPPPPSPLSPLISSPLSSSSFCFQTDSCLRWQSGCQRLQAAIDPRLPPAKLQKERFGPPDHPYSSPGPAPAGSDRATCSPRSQSPWPKGQAGWLSAATRVRSDPARARGGGQWGRTPPRTRFRCHGEQRGEVE